MIIVLKGTGAIIIKYFIIFFFLSPSTVDCIFFSNKYYPVETLSIGQ